MTILINLHLHMGCIRGIFVTGFLRNFYIKQGEFLTSKTGIPGDKIGGWTRRYMLHAQFRFCHLPASFGILWSSNSPNAKPAWTWMRTFCEEVKRVLPTQYSPSNVGYLLRITNVTNSSAEIFGFLFYFAKRLSKLLGLNIRTNHLNCGIPSCNSSSCVNCFPCCS